MRAALMSIEKSYVTYSEGMTYAAQAAHRASLRYLNATDPTHSRRTRDADRPGVALTFLRWTGLRATCHRGFVLTSGLYFVVHDHLTAAQLLLLGTVMSLTLVLSDIPAGVWSDAFSRKWPLVIGHGFLAAGMIMTGLVTAFPLVIVTQVLWRARLGLLHRGRRRLAHRRAEPARPHRQGAGRAGPAGPGWRRGRHDRLRRPGLGRRASRTAIVGLRRRHGPGRAVRRRPLPRGQLRPRVRAALDRVLGVFRRGLSLARRDREIWLVFAATMIVNAASMTTRLFPLQLIDLGFPSDPVLWYTGLSRPGLGRGHGRAAAGRSAHRRSGRRPARLRARLLRRRGRSGPAGLAPSALSAPSAHCWPAGSPTTSPARSARSG